MRDIVSEEGVLGGSPRLDGTRIGVVHIYRQYQNGSSPEEIASRYDDVSVGDTHRALAYLFDHPEVIREMDDVEQQVVRAIRENRPVDPEEFKHEI